MLHMHVILVHNSKFNLREEKHVKNTKIDRKNRRCFFSCEYKYTTFHWFVRASKHTNERDGVKQKTTRCRTTRRFFVHFQETQNRRCRCFFSFTHRNMDEHHRNEISAFNCLVGQSYSSRRQSRRSVRSIW